MRGAEHMDDRDADRRAVARGLRRAFAVETELPDRFRDLLDRLGGQEERDCAPGTRMTARGKRSAPRRDH